MPIRRFFTMRALSSSSLDQLSGARRSACRRPAGPCSRDTWGGGDACSCDNLTGRGESGHAQPDQCERSDTREPPITGARRVVLPGLRSAQPQAARRGASSPHDHLEPPVLDPHLTNSVGLFHIYALTGNRLVRHPSPRTTSGVDHPVIEKLVDQATAHSGHGREPAGPHHEGRRREFDHPARGASAAGQSRSSLAAVSPSMAAWSASVRPGVPRMWSTDVWVHGYG